MTRKIAAGFALALSIVLAATAYAGEPVHREIPYKKLTTLSTPRTYTFHFSIYDAANFGSELWFEEKPIRLTSKTLSYALGSGKTFEEGVFGPLDFSEQYWIQTSYWTGKLWKVIGVRDKLAVAPYAFSSLNPGPKGERGEPGAPGTTILALDDNNQYLGATVGSFKRGDSQDHYLTLVVPSVPGFVPISEMDGTVPNLYVYWDGPECTGTAYIKSSNSNIFSCYSSKHCVGDKPIVTQALKSWSYTADPSDCITPTSDIGSDRYYTVKEVRLPFSVPVAVPMRIVFDYDIETLRNQAMTAFNREDYATSRDLWVLILKLSPDDKQAREMLETTEMLLNALK